MNQCLRPLAAALLVTVSGSLSLPAFADGNPGTMTPAELKAVQEAYDAGFKAAHADMAANPSGGAPQAASVAAPVRKPLPPRTIVDLKETYSDAGDVETVQQIPISTAPLPEGSSQKAVSPRPVRAAQTSAPAAAPARATSTDQLVAEFCSATTPAHATRHPAPPAPRPVTETARADQIPDDGDDDGPTVTPEQFEADALAYARAVARRDAPPTDVSPAAQPVMQTAYEDAPPPLASTPPRRFWSEQYHTWVTVGGTGQ